MSSIFNLILIASVSAIKDQVSAAVTTPIRGVLVSRILLELVSSNLALEVLIKLWTSLFESLSEEHREAQEEILAVALVETVDAVQFIRDDVAGLTEEVQYGKDVADKAVRLLAQLVVRPNQASRLTTRTTRLSQNIWPTLFSLQKHCSPYDCIHTRSNRRVCNGIWSV